MKLNNKGVTLAELIVSFALVAVAIIYFYQTLYTVKNLYSKAQRETNEYVDVNYAYRIIDALYKSLLTTEDGSVDDVQLEGFCGDVETYNIIDAGSCDVSESSGFNLITFSIGDEEYNLYHYNRLNVTSISNELNSIIVGNTLNGTDLEKEINEKFSNEFTSFTVNGEEKTVWCLSTDEDAQKVLQCTSGFITDSWCDSSIDSTFPRHILSTLNNNNRYCIANINGSYHLSTTDTADEIKNIYNGSVHYIN
jgi:hypothetical protein